MTCKNNEHSTDPMGDNSVCNYFNLNPRVLFQIMATSKINDIFSRVVLLHLLSFIFNILFKFDF